MNVGLWMMFQPMNVLSEPYNLTSNVALILDFTCASKARSLAANDMSSTKTAMMTKPNSEGNKYTRQSNLET